ncbi:MAG: hypothetical protein C4532_02460 [Candidatus Abyssobacteria bacterium SURF_17]|uniref:GerMN domain-containing protein n=1 Tax=Candidatus Abyssobacteria bacterium SURF_17 TaxID=2093361 RepID=A0A419F7N6_9BACT|nr:MAG: hypothetical protein C4532_02460 [Candidatus Abyssubacteria bacterium SURF_17]
MRKRPLQIAFVVLWTAVVILLVGFGWRLLRELVPGPEPTTVVPPLPSVAPPPSEQEITLYFADGETLALRSEKRRTRLGSETAGNCATIISELIRGPRSPTLSSTIPSDAQLLGAYQLGDTLVLDFSRELQTNHSGGSAGELLTVYSIVNTLAENIHGISRVQILVEGNEVETLAGHLDLREPLSPNTTWMTDMSSEQPKV